MDELVDSYYQTSLDLKELSKQSRELRKSLKDIEEEIVNRMKDASIEQYESANGGTIYLKTQIDKKAS